MSSELMNRVVPVASFCSSGCSASTLTSVSSTACVRMVMSIVVVKSGLISTPSTNDGVWPTRSARTV
jgi:hypothetical protein